MSTTIPANQARGLFTQQLISVYKQIPVVKEFLGTFFPARTSDTRYLYWAVRREGEPIAVNVLRGTEGNRNSFSIETDKIVDPPYYREYFDLTQTDLYYRAFNSSVISDSLMSDYMMWAAEHLQSLHNKIKRAVEYQRAQILQTGIVTLAQGATVDFKRNTDSIVAYSAGNDWSIDTVSPYDTISTGCNFLRTVGKAQGGNFIVIMGEDAQKAFLKNPFVLERQREFNMKLDDLKPQFREASGCSYHGRVTAGSYTVDIFTYPEWYDASTPANPNTSTPYIDTKKIIIMPENPDFMTGYAAVPYLPKAGQSGMGISLPQIQRGQYVVGDYIDERNTAWIMDIKSAPIALPTAIDMIYTATVLN